MVRESTQQKLSRNRPPRVQITYDVEVGGAIETKELPFVMGVLGDFSGQPKDPLPKVKERKFINIDRDNFNEVLKGMSPRVQMQVDNRLKDDGTQLGVELQFKKLEDFEPENVVEQVAPLKTLLDARKRLSDLRNKLAGNDKLEALLDDVVRDTEKLRSIAQGRKAQDEGGK
jgi:type VI secretion system protein ImpB